MIYAIILAMLGLIAITFNKKDITKKVTLIKARIAPIFIIWGIVGIVILTTLRYSVIHESPIYWGLLIVGSGVEIVIGAWFIYRYYTFKEDSQPNNKTFISQNILGYIAILIGIATIIVK